MGGNEARHMEGRARQVDRVDLNEAEKSRPGMYNYMYGIRRKQLYDDKIVQPLSYVP